MDNQGMPGNSPVPPPMDPMSPVPPPPPSPVDPMGGIIMPPPPPHEEVLEVLARIEKKLDAITAKVGV